mmetsp:Transcript_10074/g.28308  ORF Transcript_10074/g.28308 Transcript_10074/m.28308 type:complete len:243 (+) Transcript_10074:134-862(+)
MVPGQSPAHTGGIARAAVAHPIPSPKRGLKWGEAASSSGLKSSFVEFVRQREHSGKSPEIILRRCGMGGGHRGPRGLPARLTFSPDLWALPSPLGGSGLRLLLVEVGPPDADGPVLRARGIGLAIRREPHVVHRPVVPLVAVELLQRLEVVQPDPHVLPPRREVALLLAVGGGLYQERLRVGLDHRFLSDVPEAHVAAVARGEGGVVRGDFDGGHGMLCLQVVGDGASPGVPHPETPLVPGG